MAKLSMELLHDIEKETVDFSANFDESLEDKIIIQNAVLRGIELSPDYLINIAPDINEKFEERDESLRKRMNKKAPIRFSTLPPSSTHHKRLKTIWIQLK